MQITEQQRKELEEASDPLIKWMNENCHPHCKIIVDGIRAELLEGQAIIKNEKHLKD